MNRLSARSVASIKRPGYHPDGGCLYLQMSPAGTRSWVFRFTLNGRHREAGIGSVADVSLADARERAKAYRLLLAEHIDPIEHRRSMQAKNAAESANQIDFGRALARYVEAHEAAWRNDKHRKQWTASVEAYCKPLLSMPVSAIDTGHVMRCIEPQWRERTETLKRVRGRVEAVLDWAKVNGYRTGENPARWKGHLDKLLAAPGKIAKKGHFKSLPYVELPGFMSKLREQEGLGAKALQFSILTAARSGEVRGATWAEIDLDAGTWAIPRERMKGGRSHVVPLTNQAIKLLRNMPRIDGSELIFPAARGGMLSDMTLSAVLRRMEIAATVHGMRSSFSTWTAEQTNTPTEVREACLAHVSADKVSAAYQRGDFMKKRALHMQAWCDFLDRSTGGAVVHLATKRRKGA